MDLEHPYGDFGYDLMTLTALMQAAKRRRSKMTPEEREEEERKINERKEKERINACIQQGKCPNCLSKLTRGKKDKHNDNKRTWTCNDCKEKFTRV